MKEKPRSKGTPNEVTPRKKTPSFILELPLLVDSGQAKHVRAHLETARCLYNALLGEASKRLHKMRTDPAWQNARSIPRTKPLERAKAFSHLRRKHHFSEYELHEYAKRARVSWIAEHIDSTMAQTLATRAYQAVNRVCVGKAKKVRFRSKGRGIESVEGKRNDVGLRFVLDPNAGDGGFLLWNKQVIPALIDWRDPVVQHGLRHKIKYVRLVRRKASSQKAQGADASGNRYFVQLVLEGHAFTKPKHEEVGTDTLGLDIGPSTLAIVPREGKADLITFCSELAPNARKKRRLQRKMERQRRANNPENYDEKGRVKKHGKTKLSQYCHACGQYVKKPRSQRWHQCPCGCGPVQRDLYSAFLLAHLCPEKHIPSVTQHVWKGAEPRLQAVMEGLQQRANEGHVLPRSMGVVAHQKAPRARARRLKSSAQPHQELALLIERQEVVGVKQEPLCL